VGMYKHCSCFWSLTDTSIVGVYIELMAMNWYTPLNVSLMVACWVNVANDSSCQISPVHGHVCWAAIMAHLPTVEGKCFNRGAGRLRACVDHGAGQVLSYGMRQTNRWMDGQTAASLKVPYHRRRHIVSHNQTKFHTLT